MDNIDDLLQRVFRLPQFRPRQREIIQDVLAGNDVVCVMPTGAGKSLCFQLPALFASAAVAGTDLYISNDVSLKKLAIEGISFIVGLDAALL